ncbi:hypothetical protein [Candidatus Phytoplasma pini]|uniref:Uncharacterized protein n=1 Tax=Candidatus Phytoplasma pini TaxID=267362 RepID=A0A559KJR8_9MOLU|nr:hypothetical protein [Candidatus Phytoplasma pini]TVY12370.1 hypothetical protein MDPP_00143 [Candidatus Phytoplasma pini]
MRELVAKTYSIIRDFQGNAIRQTERKFEGENNFITGQTLFEELKPILKEWFYV